MALDDTIEHRCGAKIAAKGIFKTDSGVACPLMADRNLPDDGFKYQAQHWVN